MKRETSPMTAGVLIAVFAIVVTAVAWRAYFAASPAAQYSTSRWRGSAPPPMKGLLGTMVPGNGRMSNTGGSAR